jgi:glycosyltransferase involved in cell wall biosynthesis
MRSPVVCLVVPNGSHRPEPLAVAVRQQHPDWHVTAIWAGDPHLVPVLDEAIVAWCARADELIPAWEHVLVSTSSPSAEWRLGLAAARRLLDEGGRPVVVLHVGSVAVLGPLTSLVPTDDDAAVRVPRTGGPPPDDGATPTVDDLLSVGSSSTTVAAFGLAGAPVLDWLLAGADAATEDHGVRRWQSVHEFFAVRACTDPAIAVGRWRWDSASPALLDLDAFDPEQPWVLDASSSERARVGVVDHPGRTAALAVAAPQVAGRRDALLLPGGVAVDGDVAALVRAADEPPPLPWSDAPGFRAWLAERYWTALHARRRDLAVAFPDPVVGDAAAFQRWVRRACLDDGKSLVLAAAPSAAQLDIATPRRNDGVNLVGYLTRESSLGDVARRLAAGLTDALVPVAPIGYERTASPKVPGVVPPDQRIEFGTTLAVVNADQFPALRMDHPELFDATEWMIGYWFWELEHIPQHMRSSIGLVDEIWAGSQFVVDAFAAVARVPVHHVPIPVPEPVCSDRRGPSFAPLADVGDRPVLGVVLDHFSVTARKNPIGAIEAFRRAFRPDEGPVLVVKTMNGEHRWPQHQELVAAAAGRSDIRVWDVHLSRADHMGFIRSLDALVSLHRSEGLGLHLAEAMWLGTPVIATRYSGNLDLMDDDCSVLIDAEMVRVEGGEGVYPPEARWADPDLDQAASAMRRLVEDPAWRGHLARAGRARMESQPTMADTAARVAALLRARMAS